LCLVRPVPVIQLALGGERKEEEEEEEFLQRTQLLMRMPGLEPETSLRVMK
jgi:hypothetical protein